MKKLIKLIRAGWDLIAQNKFKNRTAKNAKKIECNTDSNLSRNKYGFPVKK